MEGSSIRHKIKAKVGVRELEVGAFSMNDAEKIFEKYKEEILKLK